MGKKSRRTLVETGVAFLSDDAAQSLAHALLLGAVARHVHLALDRDVGVCHRGGKQLAQCAQEEGNGGGDLPLLLQRVLHLLEERILKNGVDDQDQCRNDTREQGLGALVLEERHEHGDGARVLGRLHARFNVWLLVVLLARRDASVHHPDRVGDNDGRRAGDGASNHRLDGGELLARPTGLGRRFLEEGASPFVPVVVYEVGDTDAEESGVDARVQAGDAFACNDLLDCVEELALGLLRLDLGASGKGDQRVSAAM